MNDSDDDSKRQLRDDKSLKVRRKLTTLSYSYHWEYQRKSCKLRAHMSRAAFFLASFIRVCSSTCTCS
eukprot:4374505-Amphidinium_carterae.1